VRLHLAFRGALLVLGLALAALGVGIALALIPSDRPVSEPIQDQDQPEPARWAAAVPAAAEGARGRQRPFLPVSGVVLDGIPYLLDSAAGRLVGLDGGRNLVTRPLEPPRGEGLRPPRFSGAALSATGSLLVADLANGQIWQYAPAGRFLGPFLAPDQREAAGLSRPSAIVVDRQGRVLVADVGDQTIKVFGKGGGLERVIGSPGSESGQLEFPNGLAVDQANRLLVADTNNRRVQVFDEYGRFVDAFSATDPEVTLTLPRSLGVDGQGRVHVVDTFAERVSLFASDGRYLGAYGTKDGHDLSLPEGIVISGDQVLVGDRGTGRLMLFTL